MWLYFAITIYIIGTGLLFGRSKLKQIKIFYLVLTFGLFTILAMFRSSTVGNDTSEYIRLFGNIASNGDLSNYYWRYERGYLYLNKILAFFSTNPQVIIIVSSLIIMTGFARFIYKYSDNLWLSVYLFFTLGYFGSSMNTIRLHIAIVIILFSYDYLRSNNLLKFVLTVIIASLFHRTAIIFLAAWLIVKLKFNIKTVSIAIIGTIGIDILFPYILQLAFRIFPTYQYYLGSTYLDGNTRLASVISFLVSICMLVFGFMLRRRMKTEVYSLAEDSEIIINDGEKMSMLLLIGIALTVISFNFNLIERAGEFFSVFSIIYLPNSLKNISNKKIRLNLSFLIVLLFFIYSTSILVLRPDWNVIYPYFFFS